MTLTKVRGVESAGMMCGMGELGLLGPGEVAPKEVVVLRSALQPGTPFEPSMVNSAEPEEEEAESEEEDEVVAPAPKAKPAAAISSAMSSNPKTKP